MAVLRPTASPAHQCDHLRLCGQRHVRRHLLQPATIAEGTHVQRRAQLAALLGLAADHRGCCDNAAPGHHHQQGVCRAGVAHRHRDHIGMGGVRNKHVRNHPQAPRTPPVRGHLVLYRHLGHRGHAPHREFHGDARDPLQELQLVRWGAGCVGAVVVWSQRGGLLPHHALPGLDVLLHAQGRQPSGVQLQALDHPLLGADLHLHLGRSAPPAIQRAARLGTEPRHRVQHHAHRTQLGRYAQWATHPARSLGPGAG